LSETATLKVGDEAPDFELPSSPAGEKFKLSDQRGKNAVIINFVPFAFSPPCSSQLPLIEQKRAEFESQGAMPVAISVDNPFTLAAWKKELGVNYPVLSDANPPGATAKQYGVFLENRSAANRVVIVVDKQGKIAWIQPSEKLAELPDYDPVMSCPKG